MRQIQVERLAPAYRFLQGLEGLAGKGLRQEDVLPVVFDHVLHGRHVPQLGFISEVIRSQITLRQAGVRAGYVHEETHVVRRGAGGSGRCPVGFPYVDGVVARITQQAHHRGGRLDIIYSLGQGAVGAESVDIPVRTTENIGLQFFVHRRSVLAAHGIGRLVARHGNPVRNVGMDGVHAGHQACARRRGYRTGIGMGKQDTLLRQPLHVGGMELAVAGIDLVAIGHRTLRPTIIVHEEKDDIGSLFGQGRHCRRQEGRPQKGRFPNVHMHGSVIVTAPAGRCRGWYRRAGPRADRGCAGWDCRGNAARYPAAPG